MSTYRKLALAFGLCIQILMTGGCTKSTYDIFQKKVELAVSQDHQISQKEYNDLLKFIESTRDPWAKGLKDANNDVNLAEFQKLIIIISSKKGFALSEQSIWQPPKNKKSVSVVANFFLENSASMDGYVNGNTDFEASILEILSKLKVADNITKLNYGFVGSDTTLMKSFNTVDEIKAFTDSLEPVLLQSQVGNRKSSDIASLISNTLRSPQSEQNSLTLLVSDFIFSPPKGLNAEDYLASQSAYLEAVFSEKLKKNSSFEVEILQFTSRFKGIYYDKTGGEHQIDAERPYYVWIMGSSPIVEKALQDLNVGSLRNIQNKITLKRHSSPESINYALLTTTVMGANPQAAFDIEKALTSNVLADAKMVSQNGLKFLVDVAIELNDNSPNLNNFRIDQPDYKIVQLKVADALAQRRLPSATHVMTISYLGKQQKLPATNLNITYTPYLPQWVSYNSTHDDTHITNANALKTGTFGFDSLAGSAFRAFNPANQPSHYFNILIQP